MVAKDLSKYLNLLFFIAYFCSIIQVPARAQGFNPDESPKDLDLHPPDVIHWQAIEAKVNAQGVIEIGLLLTTEQSFTLYKDKLSFKPLEDVTLVKADTPPTAMQIDPITGKEVEVYAGGEFILTYATGKKFDKQSFPLEVFYLGCTSRICLFPYTETLNIPLHFTTDGIAADIDLEERLAQQLRSGQLGLLWLFVVMFLGGLLTNLTPCVAPMIPITMRLLGKKNTSPLGNALAYAGGILITYTIIGVFSALTGKAFGNFMSSPWVNGAFALVMAVLAFSMLGFVNLTFLQTLGSKMGGGKSSLGNAFAMGASAGLVAAPCTGPILGALFTYLSAKQIDTLTSVALMFTYSFGFALPYVFLGSAAAKASKIKVSPLLQIFIKIVFAAVMFALSWYFLRIPFYGLTQALRTQWGLITGVTLLLGLAFSGFCFGNKKWQNSKRFLLLPAILLSVGIFAAWQWRTATGGATHEFTIVPSMEEGFAFAKEGKKFILVDNWAEWCEACKKMDVTTFVDPDVISELKQNWIVVKMDLTEGNDLHQAHQEKYGIQGLPTLILLPPEGDIQRKSNILGYVSGPTLLSKLKAFREK